MRLMGCVLVFAFISTSCAAYISGIAIQSEAGSNIQVFVNGKLFNKRPEKFVRIRSTPGLFHIELKIFNTYYQKWQIIKKDVRLTKGYDTYYRVVFIDGKATLKEVKRYPIYSKYFLNPALHNKHPIS